MNKTIITTKTRPELIEKAANFIVAIVERSVRNEGRCSIALAGGNTPREVYRALAAEPFKTRIDWNALHLFWGDERVVPPDHPDSNFGMANEALLSRVPIPEANVHRIRGEITAEQAANEYTAELTDFFKQQPIEFDLVLLGIGEDGHTASLFPGTEAVTEKTELVTAVFVPKLDKWRVTLTFPVIDSARHVAFLVAGKSKARIVKKLLALDQPEPQWPASLVQPRNGKLYWLLDSEAALLL